MSDHPSRRPLDPPQDAPALARVTVLPHNGSRQSIGIFSDAQPPRGFVVELTPDPHPTETVSTRVIRTPLGNSRRSEFLLCVTNRGQQAVTATVRQL